MRAIVLLLICSMALAACARTTTNSPRAGNAGGDPVEVAPDPVSDAQADLIFPTVGLGEALIQAERQLDRIRHEVPRGEPLRAALAEYQTQVAELRIAAAQVAEAAEDLDTDDETVAEVAAIVDGMLTLADEVAGAAEAERAAYARLAEIDVGTDGVVAAWEQTGTQTELRTVLTRLSTQSTQLTATAEDVPATPPACPAFRDHRARWATIVGDRSETLAGLLRSGSSQFDVRREEFRALPYGEDRVAADAADRPCWLENSGVVGAEAQARAAVEQLRLIFTGR
jgi:hypothetical protein